MLSSPEIKEITALLKREVIPAIGCTEPIAVALCAAKSAEVLGSVPTKISVYLSANILKNAMGVGIPGTGMVGLPIAVALGALIGKSEYELEVLKDLKPEDVERGKALIAEKRIKIDLKENITDNLYIEIHCENGKDTSCVIIKGTHTNMVYIEKDGKVLLNNLKETNQSDHDDDLKLSFSKVYEYSMETPIEDLRFILKSAELNKQASIESQKGNFGHTVGRTVTSALGQKVFGNTILSHMLSYTSSACDARMGGAMIPVMSNSGSGNQGIMATLPVVSYAEDVKSEEDKLVRALVLSNLTVIYIKQKLGRLSALCGCVVSATGASCGITYLMGGTYEQITYAVKNIAANITGMICDGAKPSCALKISSGVSTAALAAIMAMENKTATSLEGIIDDDVDKTLENMANIGAEGMKETDKMVLNIMTHK